MLAEDGPARPLPVTRPRCAPPAPVAEEKPAAATVAKNGADYTVASGDTLGKIASSKKVAGGWKALYERNKDVLSSPDTLRVGQQIDLH